MRWIDSVDALHWTLGFNNLLGQWSPTGKPVVPQNNTHLRQGFGGSSAGERNPPKHDRLIAEMAYRTLTHSSTAKAVVSCVGG